MLSLFSIDVYRYMDVCVCVCVCVCVVCVCVCVCVCAYSEQGSWLVLTPYKYTQHLTRFIMKSLVHKLVWGTLCEHCGISTLGRAHQGAVDLYHVF